MVDLFMGHCDGLKQHHASPAALRTLSYKSEEIRMDEFLSKFLMIFLILIQQARVLIVRVSCTDVPGSQQQNPEPKRE
jgi:hypothetical protein